MKMSTAPITRPGGFMKKTFVFLGFVAILAITVVSASAGSGIVLCGDVPFDFYVENQILPAGEYHFEMGSTGGATTSTITVRAKDGMVVAFVATRPGFSKDMAVSRLNFNGYGGKYFLSSIQYPGYKSDLRTTRHEKELMNQPETEQIALILPIR